MDNSDELNAIFERIVAGSHTKADVDALRHVLREDQSNWVQIGKYNIKISRGEEI